VIGLPLETERLVIRPFEPERDAEPLHELWGDAEAMQFVPSGPRASVDQTRELLESLSGRAPEGLGFWALEERGGGRLVGGVGLFPLAWKGPELELAYHVVPAAWGRGYATEAGGASIRWAFEELGYERLVSICVPANIASRRVMEKLGFRVLEVLPDSPWGELWVHALDKSAM
jgi:RimJ/RimL family protein N-acetyltransferase